jgi:hypothetical protein
LTRKAHDPFDIAPIGGIRERRQTARQLRVFEPRLQNTEPRNCTRLRVPARMAQA